MTFLSTVSVLASSIVWLMSQLANVMFFLLQLLIISMTFCPSEPLQKLCTAEKRICTNPAFFQSEYSQKNMIGIILYGAHDALTLARLDSQTTCRKNYTRLDFSPAITIIAAKQT